MQTYNNTLRDLISFLKAEDGVDSSFSTILPTVLSMDMDGISGIVIGNLFSINKNILPEAYSGLDYVIKKIKHSIQNNIWTSTIESYPFKSNDGQNNISDKKIKMQNAWLGSVDLDFSSYNGGKKLKISAPGSKTNNVPTVVKYFLNDTNLTIEAVAALVGGFMQESTTYIRPETGFDLKTGLPKNSPIGIAQWLGTRKTLLSSKPNNMSLTTQLNFVNEELTVGSFKSVYNRLQTASTLDQAIAAAAYYESFSGYQTGDSGIFTGGEWGSRAKYALDLYNRIKAKEFGDFA